MTPAQWARVLRAGAGRCEAASASERVRAIGMDARLPLSALAVALNGMADEAEKITEETA